jgi:hypothetical protein
VLKISGTKNAIGTNLIAFFLHIVVKITIESNDVSKMRILKIFIPSVEETKIKSDPLPCQYLE